LRSFNLLKEEMQKPVREGQRARLDGRSVQRAIDAYLVTLQLFNEYVLVDEE
jgi:hypothetical protein